MPLRRFALAAALLLAMPAAAYADNGGKHGKPDKDDRIEQPHQKKGRTPGKTKAGAPHRFDDGDRQAVNDYFRAQFRTGNCPPGLAKKGKGCTPPGQARKWQKGQPLPPGTVTYPLPSELLARLPLPPEGQEYVRVANDVLTVATGTSMVLDAIRDIGR